MSGETSLQDFGFDESDPLSYYLARLSFAINKGAGMDADPHPFTGFPVFIVGAARSGTALLARILKNTADCHVLIEHGLSFGLSYAMALAPDLVRAHRQDLARYVRSLYGELWSFDPAVCESCKPICRDVLIHRDGHACRLPGPAVFVTTDHNLLFSPEVVLRAFPQAQFVHVQRNGPDVVASMMHFGLSLGWLQAVSQHSGDLMDNPFLGTQQDETLEAFAARSLAEKAALRWLGAAEQGIGLQAAVPSRVHTLRYEDLVTAPGRALTALAAELRVRSPLEFGPAPVHVNIVGAWRRRLRSSDVEAATRLLAGTLGRLGYDVP